MQARFAGALVFVASGSVLVLEILAGRLLAPYVGVSLETFTGVIGVVLAGIATGTWRGGRLADRTDPGRCCRSPSRSAAARRSPPCRSSAPSGRAPTAPARSSIVFLAAMAFFAARRPARARSAR